MGSNQKLFFATVFLPYMSQTLLGQDFSKTAISVVILSIFQFTKANLGNLLVNFSKSGLLLSVYCILIWEVLLVLSMCDDKQTIENWNLLKNAKIYRGLLKFMANVALLLILKMTW